MESERKVPSGTYPGKDEPKHSLEDRATISKSDSHPNDYRHFDSLNLKVMATVAPHTRSRHDPETGRENLPLETGQNQVFASSGHSRVRGGIGFFSSRKEGRNVDEDGDLDEVDPWPVEPPYAPVKFKTRSSPSSPPFRMKT